MQDPPSPFGLPPSHSVLRRTRWRISAGCGEKEVPKVMASARSAIAFRIIETYSRTASIRILIASPEIPLSISEVVCRGDMYPRFLCFHLFVYYFFLPSSPGRIFCASHYIRKITIDVDSDHGKLYKLGRSKP